MGSRGLVRVAGLLWVCGLVWVGGLVSVSAYAIRSRIAFCNAALAPLVTSSSRYGGVVLMRGRAKKAKIAYGAQTDSQYSMRPLHTTFGPGSTLKARGAYWFALVYTAVALGCAYVPLGVFS